MEAELFQLECFRLREVSKVSKVMRDCLAPACRDRIKVEIDFLSPGGPGKNFTKTVISDLTQSPLLDSSHLEIQQPVKLGLRIVEVRCDA